jgi:hypothetical protein
MAAAAGWLAVPGPLPALGACLGRPAGSRAGTLAQGRRCEAAAADGSRAPPTCCTWPRRDRLLQHAPRVWALLAALQASPHVSGNVLARLLSTKLAQRVATVLLQQRLAPWRYTRASVQLAPPPAPAAAPPAAGEEEEQVEEQQQEYEIAEEVEEVIEALLAGLQDRDTIVRWSAAKGVGRVTGCLPRELGDEVVESVLELFRPTGGRCHG